MINFFYLLGHKVINFFSYLGGITSLFAFSIKEAFNKRKEGKSLIRQIIIKQIFFTGYQALSSISFIALSLGMITIIQTFYIAPKIGAEGVIGKILVAIIVREVGPLLTAIILIGRSGTAIATEIGNMMVSDEFDALESIGVDPLRFIVYPRLIGMIVSLMGLVLYFDLVGLLGGYLAARIIGISIPFSNYINTLFASMSFIDIIVVLFKSFTMGSAIAVIAVMHGFKVGRSSTMVPVAATRSVVNSLLAVFIVDGVITIFSYI